MTVEALPNLTPTETDLHRLLTNNGYKVLRHGWPDFFVVPSDGSPGFAVEVKAGVCQVSPGQAEMRQALEAAGERVLVVVGALRSTSEVWGVYSLCLSLSNASLAQLTTMLASQPTMAPSQPPMEYPTTALTMHRVIENHLACWISLVLWEKDQGLISRTRCRRGHARPARWRPEAPEALARD